MDPGIEEGSRESFGDDVVVLFSWVWLDLSAADADRGMYKRYLVSLRQKVTLMNCLAFQR